MHLLFSISKLPSSVSSRPPASVTPCNRNSLQLKRGKTPGLTSSFGFRVSDFGFSRAFTLIEVLLALAIFSVVLVSINTVFFAGLRLRQRATENLENALPIDRAFAIIRRDLQNAVAPGGPMAGHFVSSLSGSPQAGGTSSASSSSSASANRTVGAVGMAQIGGFDFHTSTGILRDEHPWAAIQEVNYQLMPAADRSRPGNDLVRTVNRNLLAVATQTPETERLIGDIEYVEFAFYDGMQWRDTWDSSAGDNGLPSAVRVRIQPATTNKTNIRLEPMEMIVVIQTQGAATNSTTTASAQ